jgi:ATP-dependent helicase/nuclease subunit A
MASAGTGKTWLLVTRLVRLLMDGSRPDAILAITFTRKAAAEMHNRLAERLSRLASADEETLDNTLRGMGIEIDEHARQRSRRLYEELLRSRHTIKTTTFHAFCQDILRRFPLEADVPPGFELVERTGDLLHEAKDLLIGEATAEPEGATARVLETLLTWCGSQNNLSLALDSFIAHRSDWWAFTEGKADALNLAIKHLSEQLGINLDATPLDDLFSSKLDDALAEFGALLEQHSTKTNLEHLTRLGESRTDLLSRENRYALVSSVFLTQEGNPRSRKPNATQEKKMGEAGQIRFLELHEAISRELIAAQDKVIALDALKANIAWFHAGQRLLDHYQRIKQEQRLLDFSDLEWRAYRLLNHAENAHWVQYKLDQRIDHLLVDEFQDTNPTQWNLLLPLLSEMAAGEQQRRRSIFLVGDAKQSIYRFRRAEPRLFTAANDWLKARMDAHNFGQHTSWRSARAIIDAVNTIFRTPSLAGTLTDFPEHATHLQDLWGRVTLLPLTEESPQQDQPDYQGRLRNPLFNPRFQLSDDRYVREGELIATEIKKLFAEKTLLGPTDTARPVQYSDILLLVRNRTHVAHYEQALRKAGIPYIGAERGTLLESLEVRDMVALLNSLITPYDNLALASVLRSPLFSCSDEEMMLLAGSLKSGESWMKCLRQLAATLPTDSPLGYAAYSLGRWQSRAGHLPIHDLLDGIYNEGNVLARYHAAYPEHLRQRVEANLLRFIELALEIDSGRYPSLTHFLARLEELRLDGKEAPDEAPATWELDRVRIMTIHAAKGLEAPVVFLADSAANQENKHAFEALIQWPPERHAPATFLLVGRKEQRDAVSQKRLAEERHEASRESANLLYVALTRAKQLLYITGSRPKKGQELGWYGTISAALAPLEDDTPLSPLEFEQGQCPTRACERENPVERQPETDPQLSKPVRVTLQEREIAPSYRIASHTLGETVGDEDGKIRGIAIHRILELLVSGIDASRIVPQVAVELKRQSDDLELASWWGEAITLYHDSKLGEVFHPEGAEQALAEVPVIYREQGATVHGIIDRLLVFSDRIWVIDYKSHRAALTADPAELAAPYQGQMSYYAAGMARLWPEREIRCSLLFTVNGKIVDLAP